LHLPPHDPNQNDESSGRDSLNLRMTSRLDALCASHDRTAARLHLMGRPDFERACGAMRRFGHLRDLMRLRLYAARGWAPASPSDARDGPLAKWPELLRASKRFERLARGRPQGPRR